jgi:hypothetical protein
MFSVHIQLRCALFLAAIFPAGGSLPAQTKNNSSPSAKQAQATKPAPSPARSPATTPSSSPYHGPSATGAAENHPTTGAYMANRPSTNSGTPANRPLSTTKNPMANHPNYEGGSSHPARTGSGGDTDQRHTTDGSGYGSGRTDRGSTGSMKTGVSGRLLPRGSQPETLRDGSAIQKRANGSISDIHDARRGMDIHHGLNGNRSISVERADHSRIFAERGRPGFVQHPYSFRGHDFARRTYYYRGRVYDRFYRPYHFHNADIEVYAPVRYYSIGFYNWVSNPWYQSMVYSWGWGAAPWVGYYSFYFSPYAAYPGAPYWITDYMISLDLQADYAAAQDSETLAQTQPAAEAPELTPEVKQQIADEVKLQIAVENSEAEESAQNQEPDPEQSGISKLFADGHTHVFVVGSDLDVADSFGAECALSGGDVLELTSPPPADAQVAELLVLSSKSGQECQKSDTVSVALNDLQDMQNHMRETIDQGMRELQAKQGRGGLPQAPPSAQAPPVDTPFAQAAPPTDPNGAREVSQQLQQADAAEQEVVAQSQQESGSDNSPSHDTVPETISLGQTIDQVTSSLGQPIRVFDLGAKQIYQYKDLKITFNDGKVAEVQ